MWFPWLPALPCSSTSGVIKAGAREGVTKEADHGQHRWENAGSTPLVSLSLAS